MDQNNETNNTSALKEDDKDLSFEDRLKSLTSPFIYKLLGFAEISDIYKKATAAAPAEDFVNSVLKEMNVSIDVPEEELENIPKTGQ